MEAEGRLRLSDEIFKPIDELIEHGIEMLALTTSRKCWATIAKSNVCTVNTSSCSIFMPIDWRL